MAPAPVALAGLAVRVVCAVLVVQGLGGQAAPRTSGRRAWRGSYGREGQGLRATAPHPARSVNVPVLVSGRQFGQDTIPGSTI